MPLHGDLEGKHGGVVCLHPLQSCAFNDNACESNSGSCINWLCRFTTVNGTMPISSMGSVYPPPDMMQVNDVEITEAVRHTNMASFLETSSVERVYEPGDYLMRKV